LALAVKIGMGTPALRDRKVALGSHCKTGDGTYDIIVPNRIDNRQYRPSTSDGHLCLMCRSGIVPTPVTMTRSTWH
jgi:hypothetical protein